MSLKDDLSLFLLCFSHNACAVYRLFSLPQWFQNLLWDQTWNKLLIQITVSSWKPDDTWELVIVSIYLRVLWVFSYFCILSYKIEFLSVEGQTPTCGTSRDRKAPLHLRQSFNKTSDGQNSSLSSKNLCKKSCKINMCKPLSFHNIYWLPLKFNWYRKSCFHNSAVWCNQKYLNSMSKRHGFHVGTFYTPFLLRFFFLIKEVRLVFY